MSDQDQPQDDNQLEGGQDPAGDATQPADTGATESQPAGGSRTFDYQSECHCSKTLNQRY